MSDFSAIPYHLMTGPSSECAAFVSDSDAYKLIFSVANALSSSGEVLAVVITALFTLTAYLITNVIGYMINRNKLRKLKYEAIIALKMEMQDTLSLYNDKIDKKRIESVKLRIATEPGYMPYAPTVRSDFNVTKISNQIALLSGKTQKAFLSFYYTDSFECKIMEDFRRDEIRNTDPIRRMNIYDVYVDFRKKHRKNCIKLLSCLKKEQAELELSWGQKLEHRFGLSKSKPTTIRGGEASRRSSSQDCSDETHITK